MTRHTGKRIATSVVLTLVAATVIAACGGSGGGLNSSPASDTSNPTNTSTAKKSPSPADWKAGLQVFDTAGCSGCHTLAAANSNGNVGPDLDQLMPSDATVMHQVENGGGGMPSFASTLTHKEIVAVAKFVSQAAGR